MTFGTVLVTETVPNVTLSGWVSTFPDTFYEVLDCERLGERAHPDLDFSIDGCERTKEWEDALNEQTEAGDC